MSDQLKPFEDVDAILREDTQHHLEKFVENGGKLTDACECLSQGYEGFPEMIRTLVDWIDTYADGLKVLEDACQKVLLTSEPNLVPKLDKSLAKPGGKELLAQVVSSERWSPVITGIASRNSESKLYSMLMREKRLKDAALDMEIINSPESLIAGLEEQFRIFLKEPNLEECDHLKRFLQKVIAMCCYDEHAMIVGMRYISYLTRVADDAFVRGIGKRIGEDVRKEIVKVLFAGSSISEQAKIHDVFRTFIIIEAGTAGINFDVNVIDAILNVLKSAGKRDSYIEHVRMLTGIYGYLLGDVRMMQTIEDGNVILDRTEDYSIEQRAFLIQILCHTEVLDDIMKAAFSFHHRSFIRENVADTEKRRCLVLLLAYSDVFKTMQHEEIYSILDDTSSLEKYRSCLIEVMGRYDIVTAACEACPPATPWFKIKKVYAKTLVDGVEDVLMARGVYMWVGEALRVTEDERSLAKTAKKYLAFLQAIAAHHLELRPRILDTVHEAFVRDYPGLDINQIEELRDMYISYIIALTRIQMAPEVVDAFLADWAGDERVDKAHLRRFVSGLLDTITLPFTEELGQKILRLVYHSRVMSALDQETKARALRLQQALHESYQ